eukprot:TRINITY_DN110920_c0_g1_i1.p1 TRINITY_DN110920_c0_g1~~TRINITY_DN110920_c0_g1_i1.p1  ORF type:complete len:473 (+),score=55.62 TRINITY_DN110920_c0_g1_i1:90-1508(+)
MPADARDAIVVVPLHGAKACGPDSGISRSACASGFSEDIAEEMPHDAGRVAARQARRISPARLDSRGVRARVTAMRDRLVARRKGLAVWATAVVLMATAHRLGSHRGAFVRGPLGARQQHNSPLVGGLSGRHAQLSAAPLEPSAESTDTGEAITQGVRAAHIGVAAAAAFEPTVMDAATSALWTAFNQLDITHNKMFEAHVAVGSFVVWIFLFESLHLWLPNAAKYRLDGKLPVKALDGFGKDLQEKAIGPVFSYLLLIAVFHFFNLGPVIFGPKPDFDAPSFMRVAVELGLGIFLYDLFFYPIHWSLHRLPFKAWRHEHERHHSWAKSEAAAHNATETVYHSLVDGFLQVLINIIVQQISPWGHKHPLSRFFHNILVTYLLCESHSGYDLPFMSHRLLPGVFGGSPRHEAHHQMSGVSYHQFFTYIDDALGFRPPRDFATKMFNRGAAKSKALAGAPRVQQVAKEVSLAAS